MPGASDPGNDETIELGDLSEGAVPFPPPGFVDSSKTPMSGDKNDSEPRAFDSLCAAGRPSVIDRFAQGPALPQLSKYSFEDLLGRGGMGQVILVKDRDIRRPVAMKLLLGRHRDDPEMIERFLDEAQIAGQLEHPNILPIYDIGLLGDEPFFTMKRVEGETLRRILNRLIEGDRETRQEYTVMRRLQIFQQVCLAVAYAHEKGVIHRDLKPDNIMIGRFGQVLIMDWGLATVDGRRERSADEPPEETKKKRLTITTTRFEVGSTTEYGTIKGTPAYMAPEQASGQVDRVGPRSDLFSLGVMLFELLTFEVPFRGHSTRDTLRRVLFRQPRAPSQLGREQGRAVPGIFDEVCLRALAKDPERRYASVLELSEEIQAYIDGTLEQQRRQREADEHIERAYGYCRCYKHILRQIRRARDDIAGLEKRIPPYAPLPEKAPLWQARERLELLTRERERLYEAAHDTFDAALGVIANEPVARRAKADLFWDSFLEAEEAGDAAAARHFRARLEAFDDGRYRRRLAHAGVLELLIEPPGSEVALSRLAERDLVFQRDEEVPVRLRGRALAELAPGPYLLRARAPGCAPLVLPLELRRGRDLQLRRRLPPADAVPEGMVAIAGGEAILGGDLEAASSLPRKRRPIADFCLARRPVTAGEYALFLNDLAAELGAEAALRRGPRARADAPPLWSPGADGRFRVAEQLYQDQAWREDWPIFGLSYNDVIAYVIWRGQRDLRSYRLPREDEWEWAARGPSGFPFPWGLRFDPSLCKMRRSRAGPPMPEPVGAFPTDCSPFGIRDMAGGVHEWCHGEFDRERGMITLRGGSWLSDGAHCRCAARIGDQAYDRSIGYGFRLALDLATARGARG